MSTSIHAAAAHLQRHITAPPGCVNTVPFSDADGPLIRVLVDRSVWGRIGPLPAEYEGYRVAVELRGEARLFTR
jgi:hypothetical protein